MVSTKFGSAILFAVCFLLLSCSNDSNSNNDNDDNNDNGGNSSNDHGILSSSSLPSSSSVTEIPNSSSSSEVSSSSLADDGYSEIVKAYALEDKTGNSFAYTTEEELYECKDGGELKRETASEYKNIVNYSINNNAMVWKNLNHDDTLNFKGTSNNLIGVWTREYDREASCERLPDDDGWSCKSDWDIVKAEFTEDSLKITRPYCRANYPENYDAGKGWKIRNISCNTYEMYKGTEKITVKIVPDNMSYTYKENTCVRSYAVSDRKKACEDAWVEFQKESSLTLSYYYNKFLTEDYNKCLQNTLPAELLESDDDD